MPLRDRRPPPGTEPLTARSPLGVRAVLSGLALVGGIAAAVFFGVHAAEGGRPRTGLWAVTAVCGAVAVLAAVDLWVIWRRSHGP
jgi:hypothetical protein